MTKACILCGGRRRRLIFTKSGYNLLSCKACGLVVVENPPSPDELIELYSFEKGYQKGFVDDPTHDAVHRRRAGQLLKTFNRQVQAKGHLLDIGCSAGYFLCAARGAGWSVRGLELSPDTARLARERFALDVKTGQLARGCFPNRSFDAVTLWDVVEHLPNPMETMEAVTQLLKPGGVVALRDPLV